MGVWFIDVQREAESALRMIFPCNGSKFPRNGTVTRKGPGENTAKVHLVFYQFILFFTFLSSWYLVVYISEPVVYYFMKVFYFYLFLDTSLLVYQQKSRLMNYLMSGRFLSIKNLLPLFHLFGGIAMAWRPRTEIFIWYIVCIRPRVTRKMYLVESQFTHSPWPHIWTLPILRPEQFII